MAKPTRPADGVSDREAWLQYIHDAVVEPMPEGAAAASKDYVDTVASESARFVETGVPALGLEGWYDAESLTQADGEAVPSWPDRSGNDRTLTKGGTGSATLDADGLNGKQAVTFDGASWFDADTLADWNFLHGSQSTVFVVFQATANTDAFLCLLDTGGHRESLVGYNLAVDDRSARNRSDSGRASITRGSGGNSVDGLAYTTRLIADNGTAPAGEGLIAETRYRHGLSGMDFLLLVNGDQAYAADSYNPPATGDADNPLRVGAVTDNTTGLTGEFQGVIAEVLIYSRNLSDSERDAVRSYLAHKWGVIVDPDRREMPFAPAWFAAYWAEGDAFDAQGYADGDPVTSWPGEVRWDTYPLEEATNPPTFVASGINGRPSVEADGVDDLLQSASWGEVPAPYTFVMVFELLTEPPTGDSAYFMDGISSADRTIFYTPDVDLSFSVNDGAGGQITGPDRDTNTPHLAIMEFNGTDSKLIVDGVLHDDDDFTDHIAAGMTLFSRHDGALFSNAQIAFAAFHDAILSQDEKAAILSWASALYGVT